MKVDRISSFCGIYSQSFCATKLPYIRNNHIVDSFVAMEDKFIDAETDLIRALAKPHTQLHKSLKQRNIPRYDVPFIKTLLINPVFNDERILNEIPQMLSVKWPRESTNRLCAQGRKNLVDMFALNPILHQNPELKGRMGEILLNCRSFENSEIVGNFLDKYMSNKLLYENENLNKKLPDLIIKLQDGLYDAKFDSKGIEKGYNLILDKYLSSDKFYKNAKINSGLGDVLQGVKDYESAVKIGKAM